MCIFMCTKEERRVTKSQNHFTFHACFSYTRIIEARLFKATPNIYQHILIKPRGGDLT